MALPGSQASLLAMQRTLGNAHVTRSVAPGTALMRDPAPGPGGNHVQREPGGEAANPNAGWEPIAKLIAEQLSDAKLKEHAKTLAGKGVDLLMSQVKDATSEQDFVAKSQVELLGTMLADVAKKDAEAWAKSDEAKAFRERLLTITNESPETVLAAALAAAAIAYLANPDLPEISKKVEIVKGLTGEGKLDLGKVQQLTVQQASAALKYTSTHFSAAVSGAYKGEGDKAGASGGAELSFGEKQIQFKGALKLNPDGTVKVDLGQAIDVKKFGMHTGVEIQGDKMAAIIGVKIGDKDTYISGKTKVEPDGKVSLDLGIKAGDWTVAGTASGIGGENLAGEGSVKGVDIFGVKGLEANGAIKFGPAGVTGASAGVSYAADTKQGKAFISFKAETLAGANKEGPPIGAQGVIGVGFTFK